MSVTLHEHSTIAEIDQAIASAPKRQRQAVLDQATAILTQRSHRDAPSGRRAAAWLVKHAKVTTTTRAATVAKAGPNLRTQLCVATFGALKDLDAEGKTAWWGLYKAMKGASDQELAEYIAAK